MKDFNYWDVLYKKEDFREFNTNKAGILWLKIKSIKRRKLFSEFLKNNNIHLQGSSLEEQFIELFNLLNKDIDPNNAILDNYITDKNNSIFEQIDVDQLVSELYKLKHFHWGGDYQNSLDKYLISRYVKVNNPSFDNLHLKFETEINIAVQGYVLNSWYNYWSSVLIEHIFKSHTAVLPTVGQIKGVDFFINDIPFDLKVTYLPAEYIKRKRKEKGYQVELTFLKNKAKEFEIPFDAKAKPKDIFYEIAEKMKDKNNSFCIDTLKTLKKENLSILKEAQTNPQTLATWLYENQGEMRFGSENRLYLVLVDTDEFDNSWKLKRNIDLLKPVILNYLDNFKTKNIADLKTPFQYKDKITKFSPLSDIIFVVK